MNSTLLAALKTSYQFSDKSQTPQLDSLPAHAQLMMLLFWNNALQTKPHHTMCHASHSNNTITQYKRTVIPSSTLCMWLSLITSRYAGYTAVTVIYWSVIYWCSKQNIHSRTDC